MLLSYSSFVVITFTSKSIINGDFVQKAPTLHDLSFVNTLQKKKSLNVFMSRVLHGTVFLRETLIVTINPNDVFKIRCGVPPCEKAPTVI